MVTGREAISYDEKKFEIITKSGDLLKSWDIKRQITNKELGLAALA